VTDIRISQVPVDVLVEDVTPPEIRVSQVPVDVLLGPEVIPMSTYASAVLADGASHHWPLNEPSGTTAVDVIGGKNGTISGGVTLNQAGIAGGKAMTFNGSTGKIVTAASVTLPAAPFTMELWFKTSVVAQRIAFSTAVTGYTGLRLLLGVDSTGLLFLYGSYAQLGQHVITDGRWHHAVAVIGTASLATLFVDGVGEVPQGFPPPTSVGPVSIGWDDFTSAFWNGSIDEVAIYPLALTPAQILAHYQLGAGGGGGGLLLGVG
jgi:hypothetical protein